MENNDMDTVALQPMRVDPQSVEKELATFWRKAAAGEIPGDSGPLTRVILSNILVYAENESIASEAMQTIAEIAAEHPARSIIADAGPGRSDGKFEADVSMLCNITDRGRRLCGEEIRLRAHGITTAALGTIMPMLIPDLPVYLWTPGDLTQVDQEVLKNLVHTADHWIFDSRQCANPLTALDIILNADPDRDPPIGLHDLAWQATTEWRELVAGHFDLPSAREYLTGISNVTIDCKTADLPATSKKSADVPCAEAIMVMAWLAALLEWSDFRLVSSDQNWRMTYCHNDRDVAATIVPTKDAILPLNDIEIESELDCRKGRFRTSRVDGSELITTESKIAEAPDIRRTVQLPAMPIHDSLLQVLDGVGSWRIYKRSVHALRELLAMTGLDGG